MTEKKKKPVNTVEVSYDQYTSCDFIPPGSFYVRNAMGEYLYFRTSSRPEAQTLVDELYGKGKYRVVAAKLEPHGGKSESGEYSCRGTSTRRGQNRG